MESKNNWNFDAIDNTSFYHEDKDAGWLSYLVLDPAEREVYSWSAIGGGEPKKVRDKRAVMFGVPNNVHGGKVKDLLKENIDLLNRIAGDYDGFDFEGGSRIGRWNTYDWEDDLEALRDKIEELPRFMSRDEFIDWWSYGPERLAESYTQCINSFRGNRAKALEMIKDDLEKGIFVLDETIVEAIEQDLEDFRLETESLITELIDPVDMIEMIGMDPEKLEERLNEIDVAIETYGDIVYAIGNGAAVGRGSAS